MGARFNRQDVVLGALPVGTPVPEDVIDEIVASEGLPNEPFDWDVLPPGTTGQVLTVNADFSIGWAAATGGMTNPMTTAGDVIIGGTSGAGTRLAIGSTNQVLTVVAGAPAWAAAASSGGTVTSVSWTGDGTIFTASADTPVTTSGTLTPASLIAQAKNLVLAGPATGSNAAPTFRAIDNADLPAGSMAYAATTVKTGAYNAVVGDLIPVDTTSGSVTITLPTTPADRSRIAVKQVVQGGTNTVTIQAGGSDVFNTAGGSNTKTLTLASQAIQVEYAATPAIWYVIADDLPLSGLDSRYIQTAATRVKNTFLAGPSTGSDQAPTFRTLAQADLTSASPISSPGGTHSEQFGAGAVASSSNTTCIGNSASTANGSCTLVGYAVSVTGGYNTCVGASTAVTNSAGYSVCVGYYAQTGYSDTIALGTYALPQSANSMVIGSMNYPINIVNVCGGTSGSTLDLQGTSSLPALRNCGIISSSFNTSTDATWTGNLLLYAGDYTSSNAGKRLGVQVQSNGSAALLGFYGATPVVQPTAHADTTMTAGTGTAVLAGSTFTGSSGTGSAYTISDIVTALKAIGALAT